ncbi:MAG TPA: recombinase family protein [Stenotrophomonas sp.]|nr:recombinase family protein [Stenotrophomonas sp.]
MRLVFYFRVSTARQGASGLGLEAQRAACTAFASSRGATVVETYTEVESGKRNDRPALHKALELCRITGATLLIAKLDRLSRNARFLLELRDSGVRFMAVDMPDANNLTVGILALVAEQEREAISSRTKAALQAAKARGQVLGNPNGAAALRRAGKGYEASHAAVQVRADAHAERLRSIVRDLQAAGVTSLGAISAALSTRGALTPRGGTTWHKATVRALLDRLEGR